MAVNDPTIVFAADVVNNGNTERTPGSGVEEHLLDVSLGDGNQEGSAPNKSHAVVIFRLNGTDEAALLTGDSANQQGVWFKMKMTADNSSIWKFTNRSGSTLDFKFSVIQIG